MLPYGRLWLVAVVAAVALLGGAEAGWRIQGHRPSIVDTPDLWAYHRSLVADDDPSQVVVVGASQIQLGFHTPTFRRRFPDRDLVELAVDGHRALPVLRDLAEDEGFRGVVLLDTEYSGVVEESNMAAYLDAYHEVLSPDKRIDSRLVSMLQMQLAAVNPRVQLAATAIGLIFDGTWPKPHYQVMHLDRSRTADYQASSLERLRRIRAERAVAKAKRWEAEPAGAWEERVREVEALVGKIQARGGKVVFVSMPVCGEPRALREEHFPKSRFWDRFAARTQGVAVHFLDVPALTGFDCPDFTHLDERDAPRFTEALLDELTRRGVL